MSTGSTPLDTTAEAAVFEPNDWIRYCEERSGRAAPSLPTAAVQLLLRTEFAGLLDRFGGVADDFTMTGHPYAVIEGPHGPFVASWSAKGSSSAGGLEELIALGVRRIVVVGGAGALTGRHHRGDIVVATSALRDDGLSDHYEPVGLFSMPSATLTDRLLETTRARGLPVSAGAIWSILAYFRQTPSRLETFRDQGCIAVANETAAAFAIGSYRNVDIAAACIIGDSIADHRFDTSGVTDPKALTALIDAAIDAVGEPT